MTTNRWAGGALAAASLVLVASAVGACVGAAPDAESEDVEATASALSTCKPPEELVSYPNVQTCRVPLTSATPAPTANAFALSEDIIQCYAGCDCAFAAGVPQGTCASRSETDPGHNTYCGVIPGNHVRAAIDTGTATTQTVGVTITLNQGASTLAAGTVACNALWTGYSVAARNIQCNAACAAQQTWMQAQMTSSVFCCAGPAGVKNEVE
jgi:hypothetical protein